MTTQRDAPGALDAEARFAERIAHAYAPPKQTAEERIAWSRSLDARLAHRARPGRRAIAFAGVAVAATVCWLVIGGLRDGSERLAPQGSAAVVADGAGANDATDAWERQLLFGDAQEESDAESALPADYVAIASLMLDV